MPSARIGRIRRALLLPALAIGLMGIAQVRAFAADGSSAPVDFARDIRPILARHCYACHGPDEGQRKGKLRLDVKAEAFAEHDVGRPFVPRSVDESEALRRVTSDDPEERMPPGGAEKRLTPEQVGLLRRWVEQGATWEQHWAFQKPTRPAPPAIKDAAWPRNPIDHFVLARLERDGLAPSPEADRTTLIRRVCLDLTGLPPTPEMVARFLADPSPAAYESLVDRLLASPAYGERWARPWLDLARFADTKGYEKDLRRTIWRYRDWVIDAFNADKPYDAFTVEQLAGDLLPNPTPDQLLATAFHRNTLVNDEGGTDDEEFRIIAVKDRIDTTGQVWMGLTIGCAKCHSHKYDPISQKEYYQAFAFFDQTEDADRYDDSPTLPVPSLAQREQLADLDAKILRFEADLHAPTSARLEAIETWASAIRARNRWTFLKPERMEASSGSTLNLQADGSVLAQASAPSKESYSLTLPLAGLGKIGSIQLEALTDPSMPNRGVGRASGDGNFVLTGISATLKGRDGKDRPLGFAMAEADFSQDNYPVAHALKNPDPQHHGWAVSPQQGKSHQAVFRLDQPVNVEDGDRLVVTLDHQFTFGYPGFSLGRFRLSGSADPANPIGSSDPEGVVAIAAIAPEARTPEQRDALLRDYADRAPELKSKRDAVARLKADKDAILNSVRTPIFRELPGERKRITRMHNRGNFLDPGEKVEAATPARFHPLPKDAPNNRLGLARWLMDPENPLTARVAVNRQWSQFFGRGLVESQEDFGSQGIPPTHPDLLDWLAVDFREGRWSFKRLCRQIVTSATYRQVSRSTPDRLAKDPENRLFSRGPRFRMEAEMIRDEALAVSGLLSQRMMGPSVMPYQPDGIWKSTYSKDNWVTSAGAERHRRGLYTFIKRTSPYPAMLVFDAPSRESCTVRRISTNTPLQALVTLNDEVYIEAAQALARRSTIEAGGDPSSRIAHALQLALIRTPKPREVEALAALYRQRLAYYQAHADEAKALAAEPLGPLPPGMDAADLAALTSVCNVILNLDEFLTRG
ncbi:PSD1 and planctomycete cytochrome C domain-containing protein [Singulisphaera sp. PoT]|uniref:PSD1 and planctomycete cytochrome C domain-containing protein n=1 Tax=Singulisphaera sp. PoT TaxID=3411797 RepID=UPI003BF5007B